MNVPSLLRMSVSAHAVFVGLLAMFAGRSGVLLGLVLLAHRVVLLRLMMMMCGSVVVCGSEVMVFARRMMLRFLRHWEVSPWNRSDGTDVRYIETRLGVGRQRRTQHLNKCTCAVPVPTGGL
jgi:hypothetical protein